MVSIEADWRLVPASLLDFEQWSLGRVKTKQDLYDPKIFGPKEDYRCDCGHTVGAVAAGEMCPRCGVLVAPNSFELRRQRLGHIQFPCWCSHPLDEATQIEAFVVPPIAFRQKEDGTITKMGRKYESLLAIIDELAASLPPRGSAEFYSAEIGLDKQQLSDVLDDLIGVGGGNGVDASLSDLLLHAIMHDDSSMSAIARSCGLALIVRARL